MAGHAVGMAVGTAGQGRSWPRPRGEGWAGALAMAPMVAGLAPFALVPGAAIAGLGSYWLPTVLVASVP